MSPNRFFVWAAFWAVAIPIFLYALHRLGLYLERRGYIYYKHKKPSGGVTAAALELDRILSRPSVEHHIAAEDAQTETEENDGE